MTDRSETNIQQIKVRREYNISYTMSYPEFVELVNDLAETHLGTGLDTMDGGDAVGACIQLHAKLQDFMGIWHYRRPYGDIAVTYEDDKFEWIPHLETDD